MGKTQKLSIKRLSRNLRQRLAESEGKRRALQDRAITVHREWEDKLNAHNAGVVQKQTARLKALESLVEEQAESVLLFSDELSRFKAENAQLRSKLEEADRKIDAIDNSDEHSLLRKQLDSLLKERTSLSIENSDLKKMLGLNEHSSQVTSGSSHKKPNLTIESSMPKSPTRQIDSYASKSNHTLTAPLTEEEIELRGKVISYFERKYSEVKVAQINRGTPGLNRYLPSRFESSHLPVPSRSTQCKSWRRLHACKPVLRPPPA